MINLLYSTDAYCNQSISTFEKNELLRNCKDSAISRLVKNLLSDIRGAGMNTVQSSEVLKVSSVCIAQRNRIIFLRTDC
ncbi:unnamed protein product [Trichobilharzia regenti]|nr:unnamed protein product [Trichobilharzia regenti]